MQLSIFFASLLGEHSELCDLKSSGIVCERKFEKSVIYKLFKIVEKSFILECFIIYLKKKNTRVDETIIFVTIKKLTGSF